MEKKKRKRKQYLNDFRLAVNGEFVYTGDYFRPITEEALFSRLRRLVIAGSLSSAVFVFAAGLLPAAGSVECFYVILPFLAVIITCCVSAYKILRLFLSGLSVREYVYEKTVPAIPGWIKAEIIFSAATLLSETVFLLINGFGNRTACTYVFISLIASTMIVNILTLRCFGRISWGE